MVERVSSEPIASILKQIRSYDKDPSGSTLISIVVKEIAEVIGKILTRLNDDLAEKNKLDKENDVASRNVSDAVIRQEMTRLTILFQMLLALNTSSGQSTSLGRV